MGFIIKYSRFFSVNVQEEGSDETINGFAFFPTEECRQQLNNFNLVFRARLSGFEVFYNKTPLIPITEKICFSFGFSISNSGLFKKYGLVDTDENAPPVFQPGLYFDNLKPDETVITNNAVSVAADGADKPVSAEDTCRICQQTFHVYDDSSSPPDRYELSHKYQASPKQTIPVQPNNELSYLITTINPVKPDDLYFAQPGPYFLKEIKDSASSTQNIYLSDELGRGTAKGVIDIYWDASQDTVPSNGINYNITFQPK